MPSKNYCCLMQVDVVEDGVKTKRAIGTCDHKDGHAQWRCRFSALTADKTRCAYVQFLGANQDVIWRCLNQRALLWRVKSEIDWLENVMMELEHEIESD